MDGHERHKGAEESSQTKVTGRTGAAVDDIPDPDEDELDDLDDMLDEFSATKIEKPQDTQPNPKLVPPVHSQGPTPSDAAASEFSKQLQDQMAALMGSTDESPEMKREIEAIMQDLGTAADPGASPAKETGSSSTSKAGGPSSSAEEPFQETIRKTMERMHASGEQASAASKSEDSEDNLAQMLKDMQNGGPEGPENEEGFNKMLMGMMEQLTNKEILYEPMKELHDKFPAWMENNRVHSKADDLKRYDEQQRLVGEIVGRFELKGYSDSKAEDREFIVERMQKMQAAGSPPPDLVGDMNAAQEALGDVDSGCAHQ